MLNCVERMRKCGIPDTTILMITAFLGWDSLKNYIEACERETQKH